MPAEPEPAAVLKPPLEPPDDPALVPAPVPVDPAEPDVPEAPLVPFPPVVQVALSGYWQMPSLPQLPLGQSLPDSQISSTHAGGSMGHAASEKVSTASAIAFTM
jgi:hypothetical protein